MENDLNDKLLRHLIEIIKILAIAIIIAWLVTKFVIFKAYIPTGSMKPSIKEKDHVMITRIYKDINRGDIMVFNHKENKEPLIKRVIGLPNDDVEIKNGNVFINGNLLKEDYVIYNENVNMKLKVPEECYLFFGDNRADSFDGRKWNNPYVNKKDIEGKAIFRIYPIDRIGYIK